MTVLVTGGAGYIGSVTVEMMRGRDMAVVVLDNLVYGHRQSVDADIPFYQGDVGDRELVKKIVAEHGVTSCIHFAAYAYVGESVTDPAKYFANNTVQTNELLNTLIGADVKNIVFSSTCATYGDPQQIPISETHPQKPVNPYGWSKFMTERILETYDTAYGLKFVALRYFNAAGATEKCGEHHDPETHLIPIILNTANGEQPSALVGNAATGGLHENVQLTEQLPDPLRITAVQHEGLRLRPNTPLIQRGGNVRAGGHRLHEHLLKTGWHAGFAAHQEWSPVDPDFVLSRHGRTT